MLRALSLSDIQQETLIGRHSPRCFPHGYGRFHHGANFAVTCAQFELKIGYRSVIVEQLFQSFSILRVYIKGWNVDGKQRITRWVAANSLKRIVKIEKSPLWRRYKDALLYVRNQCPVFFLSAFSVRNVLQYMHGSQRSSAWVGERRI